ncbi:hypothetical protein CGC21_30655 [Leishmania donovani]|uniref:Uncharacterized protein n=1 Tax=Leishmania donovani TaxID=5661 RepID=A0A504XJP2_LEIDO|nr:hypothetical protein CGC21_30655 [Leishmania donovani]
MFLGGFVPRRFAQFNRDPWWMFFIFAIGAWAGEYPAMQIKYNARDLVLDPHRYKAAKKAGSKKAMPKASAPKKSKKAAPKKKSKSSSSTKRGTKRAAAKK